MNKKIISLILLAFLVLPFFVSAQTLGSMAQSIAKQVLIVGNWIVVMMWVVTGILFLSALGQPEKVNTAKIALFASIGGTILVILAEGARGFIERSFNI